MNPGSGGVSSLPVGCSGHPEGGPQWSPGGARLLTVHNHNLYTLAPNGSAITALTTEGTSLRAVSDGRWSRQGTKVAYTYLVKNVLQLTDDRALFVRSADGSGKLRLTPVGMQVHSPSWGP